MLPNGSEPLILADGTKINPIDGSVVPNEILVEVPNSTTMQREVVAARKRISDLPVPPHQMNTLSVILSYTMFGIDDEDISHCISVPADQIISIKQSDVYLDLQAQFIKTIAESDLSDVRSMFVQQSRNAANVMFSALDPEMGIGTRMSAAKDILDRAGQRPVDVVEHRHKMEGGLTIEYVVKDENKAIPTIDITPDEF